MPQSAAARLILEPGMRAGSSLSVDLPRTDGLFIVPPFSRVEVGVSGVHILQACARDHGYSVGVLYANLIFASRIGLGPYTELCEARPLSLLGERLFSEAAFGIPLAGCDFDQLLAELHTWGVSLTSDALKGYASAAREFTREVGAAVGAMAYKWIGATSCFQQNCSSIALLAAAKAVSPATVTLIGGSNCDGDMAVGLRSLPVGADFIFSGEAETTFVAFLDNLAAGRLPAERIIEGTPCQDMDSVPAPDYAEYFEQLRRLLPDVPLSDTHMVYETCRGCWKGAKSRCTFCGLRGTRVECDEKSPDRVIDDLKKMIARSPTRHIVVADNIMPLSYHDTVVPRLRAELPDAKLVWYQRSNLSLDQMKQLHDAGIRHVRAGLESLSTPILKLMRKAVILRQNLAILRYARTLHMGLAWNLLYGFPGDLAEDYRAMIDLMRLVRHLSPPSGVTELEIDRFSPYFDNPGEFGLTDIKALAAYRAIYPEAADIDSLAYTFDVAYPSGSREDPALIGDLRQAVNEWRSAWILNPARPPVLHVRRENEDTFVLDDRRGLPSQPERRALGRDEAGVLLLGGPLDRTPLAKWAIEERLAVERDGWCVALATSNFDTLRQFEAQARAGWRDVAVVHG
jgi:ribosomal peptide maturation radical SAM protein 1